MRIEKCTEKTKASVGWEEVELKAQEQNVNKHKNRQPCLSSLLYQG